MLQMDADDVCSASVATTTSMTTITSSNNTNNNNNNINTIQIQNNDKSNNINYENNSELKIISSEQLKTTTEIKEKAHKIVNIASALCAPILAHVSSAPTLKGKQTEKQQKEEEEEQKQLEDYINTTCDTHVQRSLSNVSVTPKMMRKSIDSMASLRRRVSFPKYDNELVTGYLEPANPWQHSIACEHISEVAELYERSCRKHNTTPLSTIQDHLKGIELSKDVRQPLLSLKTIKLAPNDCEALEEIFKRVQYKTIDLSACDLDESSASALFEMIEYYEATNELDISSFKKKSQHFR